MKKLYILLLLISAFSNAQIINFPDPNFQDILLTSSAFSTVAQNLAGENIKIDTNNDGEIQVSEALLVSSLDISYADVEDITGIQNFSNLISLYADGNFLSTLDVSGMPVLNSISCMGNILTSINITNATNLFELNCWDNQLTSIDFTGIVNTIPFNLDCSTNLINTFITPTPITFDMLECDDNQFVHLDLSNIFIAPTGGSFGGFGNNPITSINAKNNYTENNEFAFYFNLLEALEYICVDEAEEVALRTSFDELGFTDVQINSYCTFVPGGTYNTISGNISIDVNNDGCDDNDSNFSNIRLNITDGANAGGTFTNNAGNYAFFTSAGNYTVTPTITNPSWFNISPQTVTFPFPNDDTNSATQNFCITPNGSHADVQVLITTIFPAKPGFDAIYKIVYANNGNQALTGTIVLTYNDDLLDFVFASTIPAIQDFGNLTWNYANLNPFESRSIQFIVNVNGPMETPAVNINDVLDFTATINPIAGDENPNDNTFTLNQIVVGSYDPNDKTCLEGNIVSPAKIGEYLHYNIRFENTGTAAATFVVVKDIIDSAKYDIATLQVMDNSHPMVTRINDNKVEFIFDNINLGANEKGNVLFKIKTKNTLVTGNSVTNKADIFFDYNFPIITNDAQTTFQVLSTSGFELDNSIKVYPNPTSSIININSLNNIKSVELYDVQGRVIQTNVVDGISTTINITEKTKGIYFLKINSDNGSKIEKIVKE